MLDVTVRYRKYDNTLKRAYLEKKRKYEKITDVIKTDMGVTEVDVHGFPIGARGLWYRPNNEILYKVGLSKYSAKSFAMRLCKGGFPINSQ